MTLHVLISTSCLLVDRWLAEKRSSDAQHLWQKLSITRYVAYCMEQSESAEAADAPLPPIDQLAKEWVDSVVTEGVKCVIFADFDHLFGVFDSFDISGTASPRRWLNQAISSLLLATQHLTQVTLHLKFEPPRHPKGKQVKRWLQWFETLCDRQRCPEWTRLDDDPLAMRTVMEAQLSAMAEVFEYLPSKDTFIQETCAGFGGLNLQDAVTRLRAGMHARLIDRERARADGDVAAQIAQLSVNHSRIPLRATNVIQSKDAMSLSDSFGLFIGQEKLIHRLEQAFLQPLLHPEVYARLACPIPRGILLHGRPGSGKHHAIVHFLENVQRRVFTASQGSTLELIVHRVSTGDFVSAYVGEGERRLRELFDNLSAGEEKRRVHHVIVMKDVDLLARKRSFSDDEKSYTQSLLTTLLTALDSVDTASAPFTLLCTTSRPRIIDEAFLRPGRIDQCVVVEPPSENDVRALLKHFAGEFGASLLIDDELVARMHGWSPADVEWFVLECARSKSNTEEALNRLIDSVCSRVREAERRYADEFDFDDE